MSVNEKMTAIANGIRQLAGVTGAMKLDDMKDGLVWLNGQIAEANEQIAETHEQIENQYGMDAGDAITVHNLPDMAGILAQLYGYTLMYGIDADILQGAAETLRTLNGEITSTGSAAEVIVLEMDKVISEMRNAYAAISEQGGTLPAAQTMGGLDDAVRTIPTGAEVRTASGSATTGMAGTATIECGFKPDVVVLTGYTLTYTTTYRMEYQLAYCFAVAEHEGETGYYQMASVPSSEYPEGIQAAFTRSDAGFTVDLTTYSSGQIQHLGGKRITYTAIKYTE